ncbi:hypothetical protein BDK51DRAFT_46598 [Blyttiomyces helicus]|uniref:Uncharacterized protein n=1 Tax=Blyttiomyces helicus TaxID=388810 RepID=A0A4P9WNG9_9FUNG|nr:hypothetical protein BDK51DRAFT_46598 [Blyttiomyces helicus]|eukprot:RKO94504.1 hypothetical protein BDK51DRAFT_46598 [Blyttiomyces helicus]
MHYTLIHRAHYVTTTVDILCHADHGKAVAISTTETWSKIREVVVGETILGSSDFMAIVNRLGVVASDCESMCKVVVDTLVGMGYASKDGSLRSSVYKTYYLYVANRYTYLTNCPAASEVGKFMFAAKVALVTFTDDTAWFVAIKMVCPSFVGVGKEIVNVDSKPPVDMMTPGRVELIVKVEPLEGEANAVPPKTTFAAVSNVLPEINVPDTETFPPTFKDLDTDIPLDNIKPHVPMLLEDPEKLLADTTVRFRPMYMEPAKPIPPARIIDPDVDVVASTVFVLERTEETEMFVNVAFPDTETFPETVIAQAVIPPLVMIDDEVVSDNVRVVPIIPAEKVLNPETYNDVPILRLFATDIPPRRMTEPEPALEESVGFENNVDELAPMDAFPERDIFPPTNKLFDTPIPPYVMMEPVVAPVESVMLFIDREPLDTIVLLELKLPETVIVFATYRDRLTDNPPEI